MPGTRIFLGWSGKLSQTIATALRDWLPDVIRDADPWMSSEDLRKGQQWVPALSKNLSESNVGIIVLTNDNLKSDWILFEAGAISKALSEKHCCPLLCGLKPTDVGGPLAQFQHTTFAERDMFRLVKTINTTCEQKCEEARLKHWFDQFWPALSKSVESALSAVDTPSRERSEPTDRGLLEEILSTTRRAARGTRDFWIPQKVARGLAAPPDVFLDRLARVSRLDQKQVLRYIDEIIHGTAGTGDEPIPSPPECLPWETDSSRPA